MTEKTRSVKTIDALTSQVTEPDKKIFNENAINPAVEVNINSTGDETSPTSTP
jgi:hypothetical protein